MRTFVIGDIHGGYKALLQCLERSNFNYETDTLIQLGDVVDGWSEVYECVEELLKIKNLIAIRGNHDNWFKQWLLFGQHPWNWLQGGEGTLKSYCDNLDRNYVNVDKRYMTDLIFEDIPLPHIQFFSSVQKPYYIDSENRLFVHGGINRHFPITDKVYNDEDILMWDRDFWLAALSYGKIEPGDSLIRPMFKIHDKFKEIFIGHTTTMNWKTDKPMNSANVWNLDTGGGFKGKLTIMDVDTKEYWQSDLLQELYINEKGRN